MRPAADSSQGWFLSNLILGSLHQPPDVGAVPKDREHGGERDEKNLLKDSFIEHANAKAAQSEKKEAAA